MSMKLARSLIVILPLAGCITASDGGVSVTVPTVTVSVPSSAESLVRDIQSYTQTACRFLPAVSFLQTLLSSSTVFNSAQEYAAAICAAVQPSTFSTRRRAARGYVNGVAVQGFFI
jgi:hypothetical protein